MARPTAQNQYRPEYDEMGRKLCLLGATNADLAEAFGITPAVLKNWESRNKSFRAALERGRAQADAEVADRLYSRATGYTRKTQKAFQHQGVPVVVDIEEELPPDTIAGIFWLKNRRRENWRDRQEHEVEAGQGLVSLLSSMKEPTNVVLNRPLKGGKKDNEKDG